MDNHSTWGGLSVITFSGLACWLLQTPEAHPIFLLYTVDLVYIVLGLDIVSQNWKRRPMVHWWIVGMLLYLNRARQSPARPHHRSKLGGGFLNVFLNEEPRSWEWIVHIGQLACCYRPSSGPDYTNEGLSPSPSSSFLTANTHRAKAWVSLTWCGC